MSERRYRRQIDGDARSVRELLDGRKYSIDYYQREYKWQSKQVNELIDDLVGKFLESYNPEHDRTAVSDYSHYFLGSIIVSDKDGEKFVIDGQQRLTTLTLLLIFLHRLLEDPEHKSQVSPLILSQRFGRRSFNLDIPERTRCMDALYNGSNHDDMEQSESVVNILGRYTDIETRFPDQLRHHALPYFVDWLMEHVDLVEITAYSDEEAYTIFETMNDRGLSLTPTDMLKGYLLANITHQEGRDEASRIWRLRIASMLELGKEEDADGIKAWLRSQHAESIRERIRDAKAQDFDLIGTEFHRWVRNKEQTLGLRRSQDFVTFIDRDFVFYSQWYERLRRAAEHRTSGLEAVYYNAQHNFTLQFPLMLAPLRVTDSEQIQLRKVKLVADYLDILIHRRVWNWRAIDYSTLQYAMFLLMKEIRGRSVEELVTHLGQRLNADAETFANNDRFHLHGTNGRQIHDLLARITEYLEVQSGLPSHFYEYMQRSGKQGFEIEHVWANHPEWHRDEFAHPTDFEEYRNRIGGLLLLPKSFNASYGDLPYEDKREYYYGQNLLAGSLHDRAYDHNPGFKNFLEKTGLPFRPHVTFTRVDLDARQELCRLMAEEVWSVARLAREGLGEA